MGFILELGFILANALYYVILFILFYSWMLWKYDDRTFQNNIYSLFSLWWKGNLIFWAGRENAIQPIVFKLFVISGAPRGPTSPARSLRSAMFILYSFYSCTWNIILLFHLFLFHSTIGIYSWELGFILKNWYLFLSIGIYS